MLYKILILDEKEEHEDLSTIRAISCLTVDQKKLVDCYKETSSLWRECDGGDDVVLLRDFSNYLFIFIHESFPKLLPHEGLKAVLFEKLSSTSRIVLFSGAIRESATPIEIIYDKYSSNYKCFKILRRQYFKNLQNFLESFLFLGVFQIQYLYNSDTPKEVTIKELYKKIIILLDKSTESAVISTSFIELLKLKDYKDKEIEVAVAKFSLLPEMEVRQKIDKLLDYN